MKQYENYDDNLQQVPEDSFVVNIGHSDTVIGGKLVVIDTVMHHDTIVIEKHTYDKEIQIIEKLINKPDFGKSFASILIVILTITHIWIDGKTSPHQTLTKFCSIRSLNLKYATGRTSWVVVSVMM